MNLRLSTALAAALFASALVACGGGGSNNNNPDAPLGTHDAPAGTHDAPATTDAHQTTDGNNTVDSNPTVDSGGGSDANAGCVATVFGAQDILSNDAAGGYIAWGGPVTTDLGDGGPSEFALELYDAIEPTLVGPIDLSAGNQANYSTCAECVTLVSRDATGTIAHVYYQSGGTLTLTADPFGTQTMVGTITGLSLVEVTIDSQGTSTLVAGGKCLAVGDVTLNADQIPNGWTCAASAYNDGTTCDCMCGAPDPDCDTTPTPATGCTSGQLCPDALCVNPATNDTCQTAQSLTIGTPKNGNTAGATSNYDSGLEGSACTGFAQPGADVAYSVDLAAATAYTFKLTNVAQNFDASIALVGPGQPAVCDASPVVCLAGADIGTKGRGETFSFTTTTAGTYFVIVDSFAAAQIGAFTVTVTTP